MTKKKNKKQTRDGTEVTTWIPGTQKRQQSHNPVRSGLDSAEARSSSRTGPTDLPLGGLMLRRPCESSVKSSKIWWKGNMLSNFSSSEWGATSSDNLWLVRKLTWHSVVCRPGVRYRGRAEGISCDRIPSQQWTEGSVPWSEASDSRERTQLVFSFSSL